MVDAYPHEETVTMDPSRTHLLDNQRLSSCNLSCTYASSFIDHIDSLHKIIVGVHNLPTFTWRRIYFVSFMWCSVLTCGSSVASSLKDISLGKGILPYTSHIHLQLRIFPYSPSVRERMTDLEPGTRKPRTRLHRCCSSLSCACTPPLKWGMNDLKRLRRWGDQKFPRVVMMAVIAPRKSCHKNRP